MLMVKEISVLGNWEEIDEWVLFGMDLKVFQALPMCGLPSFRNERTFVFPSFAGWRCSYNMFAIIS
jgi:hypothetical protein